MSVSLIADNTEILDRVRAYCSQRPYVSFVELVRHLGDDARGSCAIALEKYNIVFWDGISVALSEAILELRRAKEVFLIPCESLVYLVDGGYLKLPIAKRPPENGYKKVHWVPTTIQHRSHMTGTELAKFEKIWDESH